jgi:hypothetical protein
VVLPAIFCEHNFLRRNKTATYLLTALIKKKYPKKPAAIQNAMMASECMPNG